MENQDDKPVDPISADPVKEEAAAPAQAPTQEVAAQAAPVAEELYIDEDVEQGQEAVPVHKTNAFQDFSMNMADAILIGDRLNLPSQLDRDVQKDLVDAPNVDLLASNEARRWAETVKDGLSYNPMEEGLVGALNDPDAEFRQNNTVNGVSLNSAVPKFRESTGQNLKGERSLIRMISHLDLGTVFQVLLFHSGIGITFKPPTESELIELNRQMMADKIDFGRSSYGMVYSNTVVYSIERLVNFAVDHIYDMTTKSEDINMSNIKDHIVAQDIQLFLWGFICSMYPKGFPYDRGCTDDPVKCNHVVHETLNVHKLQYTNMKALTDWQKTHMSIRQSKQKSLADVNRYKEELGRQQRRRVVINEGKASEVAITLRTPSITEYINSGHQWVDSIVNNVERVLGEDATKVDRHSNITMLGNATSMRQYSHWVESLELNGNIIDDREAVENNLNIMTADSQVSDIFTAAVVKYINDSTISVIGIPVFDCPKCGKEQEGAKTLPHHVNIIPLDVVQVFFGLTSQRMERIATR